MLVKDTPIGIRIRKVCSWKGTVDTCPSAIWIQKKVPHEFKVAQYHFEIKKITKADLENLLWQHQIPNPIGKINTYSISFFILRNHGWVIHEHGVRHRPRYRVIWLSADQYFLDFGTFFLNTVNRLLKSQTDQIRGTKIYNSLIKYLMVYFFNY